MNIVPTTSRKRADAHQPQVAYLEHEIERLKSKLQAADDLNTLLTAELEKAKSPWISVEERLPEEEDNPDEYNAPHRARSSRNVIITDGVIVNRGYYSYARMRWEWNGGKIKVTHWMPIPELPTTK